MNKIKEFLYRFLQGRYGADSLYRFLMWCCFVLLVLNIFARSQIISYFAAIILIFMLFRLLSKDTYKRQQENLIYLQFKSKFLREISLLSNKWSYRKTHIYRRCPHCRAILRLPRRKGRHTCSCPRCGRDFMVRCFF